MEKKNVSLLVGRSMLSCIAMGIIVSVVVSALMLTALTFLVVNGVVSENKASIFVFVIRLLATLVGCLAGCGLSKEKTIPVIGFITLGYFIILFALGVIVYDGAVRNIGCGLISALLGGAIVCAIKLKSQMNKGRAVRRRR